MTDDLADDGLGPEARALLAAIVAAPFAWSGRRDLYRAAGVRFAAAVDALADLDERGWIEPFELRGIPFVTLTPWGAARLAVAAEPVGDSFSWRWSRAGKADRPPAGRCRRTPDADDLIGRLVDPGPGPDERAAAREAEDRLRAAPAAERAPRDPWVDAVRRPRDFVDPPYYEGPACFDAAGTCQECHNLPLGPLGYCLACDRWGGDEAPAGRLSAAG